MNHAESSTQSYSTFKYQMLVRCKSNYAHADDKGLVIVNFTERILCVLDYRTSGNFCVRLIFPEFTTSIN